MKSYTDLEQSKKLAKILPLESADACWTNHMFDSLLSSWRIESTPPQEYKSLLDRFVVRGYLIEPAWSLAALLSVISKPDLVQKSKGTWLVRSWVSAYPWSPWRVDGCSSPVDACVEMIIKLHKLDLL